MHSVTFSRIRISIICYTKIQFSADNNYQTYFKLIMYGFLNSDDSFRFFKRQRSQQDHKLLKLSTLQTTDDNLTEPQAWIWDLCKAQYIASHTCTEPPPCIVDSVTQSYRQRSFLLRQTRNRLSVGRKKTEIHL